MDPAIQNQIIFRLSHLGTRLRQSLVPKAIIQQAISSNSWFTEYYINKSLENILQWFTRSSLDSFLSQYSNPVITPKSIGIIMAGNLPFVGFHDVLMGLFSGHQLQLKPSHQDQVLMEWLVAECLHAMPTWKDRIEWVDQLTEVDFLIATGSNNTARYINHLHPDVPAIIRKNRYSLAILNGNESEAELASLMEDVFLYNGLGCRNVSNILVPKGYEKQDFFHAASTYNKAFLNPLYLEKVKRLAATEQLLSPRSDVHPYFLLKRKDMPGYTDMGEINWVEYYSLSHLTSLLQTHHSGIQCIISNAGQKYGLSQSPRINDFADQTDILSILLSWI